MPEAAAIARTPATAVATSAATGRTPPPASASSVTTLAANSKGIIT